MQWLKTFSLVISSNVTALCERFDNPERVLHQLILDMEEELEHVRAAVAGVVADEIQLGRQVDRARAEAGRWQERAEKALRRRDEEAARGALEQKVLADQRAESLAQEYQKHKDDSARLHRAVRDLEHNIEQARHRRALLAARLARADSARAVNQVLKRADGASALGQFQRLEARAERAEALELAYDRLLGDGPEAEELARRFEVREREERMAKELEELKRRVEGG